MTTKRLVSTLAALSLLLVPTLAHAQQASTLPGLLLDQFLQNIVLARTPGGEGIAAHTATFTTDDTTTAVTALVQQVGQQIASQLSTTPLGSSSAGFTYRYDAALGTFTRSTSTFGPAFAERADTAGKGKVSFGVNYQHAGYSSLDGRTLDSGDIKFFLPHQKGATISFVQGDMIEAQALLKLSSDTAMVFASYGVTDALDLGVAVPFQHVRLELTYHATILDFATHAVAPDTHLFLNGQKTADFTSSGSASGIGDMIIRAKYTFLKQPSAGLAIGMDLHLPTGDQANLLGAGGTQTAIYLIASSTRGKLAPHVNVGFTASSHVGLRTPQQTLDAGVSDQLNYVGGVEYAASPRLTIIGDLIGRTFTSTLRLERAPQTHTFQQGPTAPVETTTLDALAMAPGSVTSVLAAAGLKFNVSRNLLVSAHVISSVNGAGLRRSVSPVLGFDFSF